jgi:hypothetical protein
MMEPPVVESLAARLVKRRAALLFAIATMREVLDELARRGRAP